MRTPPPELNEFLFRYDSAVQSLALGLRAVVLSEMAPCHEYIFSMRGKVVLLYGPTERVIKDAVCMIAVFRRHANLTFTNQLTLYMGKREIRVLNYGRAVTPGDAFLYLPNERILITGDLLINPISFALSSYPTEWLKALEGLDALDASLIIPGHGEPLTDKTLLHATMGVFRELLRQGKEAKKKGLDVDVARDQIMPSLAEYQATITKGNTALDAPFKIQLVDWYLHRVYEELDGPLTDAISAIPQK